MWHRYTRSVAIRKSWQGCVPDSTEGDSIQGTAKDFKEEWLETLFSKRHGCNGRSLLFFFLFFKSEFPFRDGASYDIGST